MRRDGFTLIEVALAILVVGIGVLAVFGLVSGGLSASAKAIAETQMALFADDVFNSLRTESLRKCEQSDETPDAEVDLWSGFWVDMKDGTACITVSAHRVWVDGEDLVVYGDDKVHTNVYTNALHHVAEADWTGDRIVDRALRYRMKARMRFDDAGYESGNYGPPPADFFWTNVAEVTLWVWEGQFGKSDTNDAAWFYSEFDNPGQLIEVYE